MPFSSETQRFLGIAAFVFILDQASKALVVAKLPYRASWPSDDHPITALFRFYHAQNTGVAFGLFQDRNTLFMILALIVALGLGLYQATFPANAKWLRTGMAMQVGGALGNAIDRVRLGHVTDFLDFHLGSAYTWPTFNIADSAIVLGVGILIVEFWRLEKAEFESRKAAEAESDSLDANTGTLLSNSESPHDEELN